MKYIGEELKVSKHTLAQRAWYNKGSLLTKLLTHTTEDYAGMIRRMFDSYANPMVELYELVNSIQLHGMVWYQ